MKRFQSILCASLLTLALSSAALAGNISGKDGNISGSPTAISGNISGAPVSASGNISGIAALVYATILELLVP